MHQVTETTIQDLIDRSIAFTHTAIEAARKTAEFNFIDLSWASVGFETEFDPLRIVSVTLWQLGTERQIVDLLDRDGNPIATRRNTEAPYSYYSSRTSMVLELPLFMLSFEAGLRDLLSLLKDPDDVRSLCSYTHPVYNRMSRGEFPKEMRDFSNSRWFVSSPPNAAATEALIPELLLHPAYIYCYQQTVPSREYFRTDAPLWHLREEARIRFNTYDQLPEPVLEALDPNKIERLFPHLPTKPGNAGLIAYTQNPTAGVMDRQAVMRAGRFIRQFAKEGTSDETVKQLTAHAASHLGSQYKHSTEREDYKRVYINGPSSCMSYDETGKRFGKLMIDDVFVHPTEVYAHPENDLEIVWMEVNDSVVARTIINKSRMQYPRVYAKESVANAQHRMEAYLADLGYTQRDDALTDQKLLKLSPTRYPHAIICPYIDSGNLGVYVRNDHLLTGGNENADHESGCLIDYNTGSSNNDWCCPCCDTDYDEDEDSEVNSQGDYICQCCADNDHTRAYCTNQQEERYVHEDETVYELTNVTRGSLRYYTYIYFNSDYRDMDHYDLVELSTSYYDSNCVALSEDCVRTDDGDYILLNDLADHDLFFNEEDSEACEISDYAIVVNEDGDPELTRISDIDEDLFEHAPAESDDTYPMLKVYTAIIQDEEAA